MKTFLLLFFSLILSLTIGEIFVRIFRLSKTYSSYYQPFYEGSRTIYIPEKNSCGWRDREFSKNKETDMFRLACIGDSITEGYRVKLINIFPKILEDNLRGLGNKAEVMNFGKAANATNDNLSALKIAMEFHPDLIIYQFGLNDIEGYEHRERAPNRNGLAQDNKIAKGKKFNLKAFLRKSILYLVLAERYNYFKLKIGYKTQIFDNWDIGDALWEKTLVILKDGLDETHKQSNILLIYMPYDFQVYSTKEEVFIPSRKLAKFCQENNYYFLDFTDIFKGKNDAYRIFLDDCHLTIYGHRIVAEHLCKFILKNIVKK